MNPTPSHKEFCLSGEFWATVLQCYVKSSHFLVKKLTASSISPDKESRSFIPWMSPGEGEKGRESSHTLSHQTRHLPPPLSCPTLVSVSQGIRCFPPHPQAHFYYIFFIWGGVGSLEGPFRCRFEHLLYRERKKIYLESFIREKSPTLELK